MVSDDPALFFRNINIYKKKRYMKRFTNQNLFRFCLLLLGSLVQRFLLTFNLFFIKRFFLEISIFLKKNANINKKKRYHRDICGVTKGHYS